MAEVRVIQQPDSASARLFTVATANAALVYVGPIALEIVDRYREFTGLRRTLEQQTTDARRARELRERLDAVVARLDQLQEEVREVGCELKDWARGLLDFPSEFGGRRIWLCWAPGEEEITHWHEWDAGFGGRQPITPEMQAG